MTKQTKAHLALLLMTCIWGMTFPLIRNAVMDMDPMWFVFIRFSVAVFLFYIFAWFRKKRFTFSKKVALPGIALGFITGLHYLSQTKGLETISSGRAAFLTGTNVIMVPFMAFLFRQGSVKLGDYIAAALACMGLYLLTDPMGGSVGTGDLLVLFCAFIYAVYILVLQKVSIKNEGSPTALAFYQIFGVWLTSIIFLPLGGEMPAYMSVNVWIAIAFCSVFATIGTFWLQTTFQQHTTPQRAALLFSMEPVFASLFGFLIIGEVLNGRGFFGAFLILLATLMPIIFQKK